MSKAERKELALAEAKELEPEPEPDPPPPPPKPFPPLSTAPAQELNFPYDESELRGAGKRMPASNPKTREVVGQWIVPVEGFDLGRRRKSMNDVRRLTEKAHAARDPIWVNEGVVAPHGHPQHWVYELDRAQEELAVQRMVGVDPYADPVSDEFEFQDTAVAKPMVRSRVTSLSFSILMTRSSVDGAPNGTKSSQLPSV